MNKWPVHCTVLDGLTGYCVVVIGQDILLSSASFLLGI